MASLIKLAFLFAAIVALVSGEGVPQPKRGDVVLGGANDILDHSRSKVLIEKPVLLEVNNVETKEHVDSNQDIQIARPVVDEIVNNNNNNNIMPKMKPASDLIGKDEANINNKDSSLPSSVPLEPIPLIMPQLTFGMPAFMQQIFDSLKSSNPLTNIESSQSSEESGTNREGDDGVRHGSLTILLMKSLKPANQIGQVIDDKSLGSDSEPEQNADGIKTRKIVLYKFMPRFRLGGKGDPDSDPNFLNDNTKNSVHLLGGIRDFDSKRFDLLKDSNSLFGENDLDRLRDPFFNGDLQPLIGGEDSKIESYDPSTANQNGQDDSFFAKIRNFLNGNAHKSETFDPEFMRHHMEHGEDGQHKPGKKCMMMNFMRLRSSVYFRTVLHLLFFTGLLMILLCLVMLTISNIRRRRALRYYNKNVNVATIEGSNLEETEQKKGGRLLFRFRFGGRRSDEASSAKSSSFLVQAPPAYDQITIGGEKKQQESKDKYSKLTNEDENDTKSLTSLPDYEQTVIMKESECLTNENSEQCPHHHHHHHPHHHHHHHHQPRNEEEK